MKYFTFFNSSLLFFKWSNTILDIPIHLLVTLSKSIPFSIIVSIAALSIEKVNEGLSNNLQTDLLAIDIRTALDALGEITGEIATDNLLDNIFSRFCHKSDKNCIPDIPSLPVFNLSFV
ncbi:MAG: hypothetical protein IH948_05065 [Bacteroidetes bacterium]|nr:hypothetical protein [Bacteroidota bacterium]